MAKMLASGLASGVPLLIVRPNLAGILARERFRRWRRELIAGVFLTAGLASPSPDPVTMLIPGGACAVPAGAAGFPAGSRDRRRARRHPDPYPGPAGDELPPPPSAGQGQGRAVSGLSLPTRPVLTVTALVIFGPDELPAIASPAGRAPRDLPTITESASNDRRERLGPQSASVEIQDLNPRRSVHKHPSGDLNADPAAQQQPARQAPPDGTPLTPGERPPSDPKV